LLIYDENNNYRYWTFNASDTWSLIIMNLSTFAAKSQNNVSLDMIKRIEIDAFRPDNGKTSIAADLGPIFLVNKLTLNELSLKYSSPSAPPRLSLTLSGSGMYTVLMPSFLRPVENGFPDGILQSLPTSDLLVNVNTGQAISLPFEFSINDPKMLLTSYVSRPLRSIGFQKTNAWSNAFSFNPNSTGPMGISMLGTHIEMPWDKVTFKLSNIDLSNGTLMLNVFLNGSTVDSNEARITVYRNDFNPSNQVAQFFLQTTQRWQLFSTPLKDVTDVYITIDNLGMIGKFYLEPLVYSYNPFY
jgi:hypothetical protein